VPAHDFKVKSVVRRLGRPKPRDVLAGLVTGLFSIPEGMAYASIGGFNPVVGLWSGVVPGIVASLFARTVLMVTTLTSAIALSSRSVLAEVGLDPADPADVAALALVVGIVMLIFGLLRFASVMNFVSNAVMTGFSTGIALQIIAGVLRDSTGYKPQSNNTIGKFVDALAHIGLWQPMTVAVAAGTVAVWAVFHFIKPLKSFAILLALVVVTVVVAVARVEVETVGDIASITNSLPPLSIPNFAAMPELLLGGIAVALVALAQAAGISARCRIPTVRAATCPATSRRKVRATSSAASSGHCRRAARFPAPVSRHPLARKPVGRESSQACGLLCLSCSPVLPPSSSRCRSSAA